MPAFAVDRSIQINASPDDVFEKVADFNTWTTWSPWLCAEPDAKVTVSDDASSLGSLYSWEGEIVGAGEMEHLKLQPGKFIEDEIRFLKPFKSTSQVIFEFEPSGGGTTVTWRMNGSLPWFMFWMVSMMEPFIGMDYERGLKMLKEWIETGDIQSNTKIIGIESVGPIRMAGIRMTCDFKDIANSMQDAFAQATAKFEKNGLPTDLGGISVYHKFKFKKQIMDYTSGFVVQEAVDIPGLNNWSIDVSDALRVDHIGSYNHLGNAWSAANQYARYKKLKQSKAGTFELYRNDPSDTQPAALQTEIYLPLK